MDEAIPRKVSRRRNVHWWSEVLSTLRRKRKDCQKRLEAARRRQSRFLNDYRSEYKLIHHQYTCEIRKAKKESFQAFIASESAADPWGLAYKVITNLVDKRVPHSLISLVTDFFKDREIVLRHGPLSRSKTLSQGCPQGSISGPSLWNVLIDGLLRSLVADDANVNAVGFADDTLVQVRGRTIE